MIRNKSLVLVVEDNLAMLRFIRRTLELNDLSVVVAEAGPLALKLSISSGRTWLCWISESLS